MYACVYSPSAVYVQWHDRVLLMHKHIFYYEDILYYELMKTYFIMSSLVGARLWLHKKLTRAETY